MGGVGMEEVEPVIGVSRLSFGPRSNSLVLEVGCGPCVVP